MQNFTIEPDAKKTYDKLKTDRQPYIDRAINCAKVTIPALFPKDNTTGNDKFETPYQSVGARGVNNLTSKLQLALFPPNAKFFRLGIDDKALQSVGLDPTKQAELDQALMQIEDRITRWIEENQVRATINEGLLHLIVAGNCLLFFPPDKGGVRLYNLKNYVVLRDAVGNILQIVTVDKVARMALPDELLSVAEEGSPESTVEVYTKVVRNGDEWVAFQELNGNIIQGSEQHYPGDKMPYIPLRMSKQDGESYGRSFVEEYYGDLNSLTELSKALAFVSMIASKIIYLVNPNGVTRPKKLQDAKSGDFVAGRKDDVVALQLDKYPDINIAYQQQTAIEQRLAFAFLLSSAVQRNAERVTAEEIRTVAQELEGTLGGIYSLLSQELQLPLIKIVMNKLMREGSIAQLPDGVVEPTITTGMEALGRGQDFNKYTTFLGTIAQLPDALTYLNTQTAIIAVATSLGINTDGLVKTQEEIQAEQQQMMENQLGMQAMEGAMNNNG